MLNAAPTEANEIDSRLLFSNLTSPVSICGGGKCVRKVREVQVQMSDVDDFLNSLDSGKVYYYVPNSMLISYYSV
jgi:sulfopyruvate decarboxylase TPP-binding subunit